MEGQGGTTLPEKGKVEPGPQNDGEDDVGETDDAPANYKKRIQLQEAVLAFKGIVGTKPHFEGADSKLIALTKVDNEEHAAPDSLKDDDIKPGVPCAKFVENSLLVWQQWGGGGCGAASYHFDLYYPDTPTTWKRFAHCTHVEDEYRTDLTLAPVDGFESYVQTSQVRLGDH